MKFFQKIKSLIWKNEEQSTQSRFSRILDLSILLTFSFTFFSIPAFSFSNTGMYVTWILTILLIAEIVVSLIFTRKIIVDFVFLSFILFCISALISSALSGFRGFRLTPIFLTGLAALLYLYCRSSKQFLNLKSFIVGAYFASIIFLAVFFYQYREELFSLSFSRLGDKFGDDNDIALFLCFGFVISFYFLTSIKKTNIIIPILSLITLLVFTFCGLATGSKIFIISSSVCAIYFLFARFWGKKWWIALLLIVGFIIIAVLVLELPFFAFIKSRLAGFFSTLIGKSVSGGDVDELSTINRLNMFVCGMELWLRKPLFGWGIWGFATFSGRAGGWSHNNISESLCNFGLIGSILFHFGFFKAFYSYLKLKKGETKKNVMLAFGLIVFYLCSMVSVAFNSQKIYAYMIGVLVASIEDSKPIFELSLRNKKEKEVLHCD